MWVWEPEANPFFINLWATFIGFFLAVLLAFGMFYLRRSLQGRDRATEDRKRLATLTHVAWTEMVFNLGWAKDAVENLSSVPSKIVRGIPRSSGWDTVRVEALRLGMTPTTIVLPTVIAHTDLLSAANMIGHLERFGLRYDLLVNPDEEELRRLQGVGCQHKWDRLLVERIS